ncbi:MAG: TIR domain-containing protein [Bacilli bacterium]
MSYKGKIYVICHETFDVKAYNKLKDMRQTDDSQFNFIDSLSLSVQLNVLNDEELKLLLYKNMDEADIVLILLSKKVKSMRKFVKWQVEYAINQEMPIICINNSPLRSMDYSITPTKLKKRRSLFISYDSEVLELACMNWVQSNKKHSDMGENIPYCYDKAVYDELNAETNIL